MSTHDELDPIIQQTISHYDAVAESFWEGTRDHDVTQNIRALLDALADDFTPPLRILDLGCGPGRDLVAFKGLGHDPVGLDGSAKFCEMARKLSGQEVLQQDFAKLELPEAHFHGVFANASLFHVPRSLLGETLQKLHLALLPRGILFCSNPRGEGERIQGQRYGNYMELEAFQHYLEESGFQLLHHYYRPDDLPVEQRPWLATVSRRI